MDVNALMGAIVAMLEFQALGVAACALLLVFIWITLMVKR